MQVQCSILAFRCFLFVLKTEGEIKVWFHEILIKVTMHTPNLFYASLKTLNHLLSHQLDKDNESNVHTSVTLALF